MTTIFDATTTPLRLQVEDLVHQVLSGNALAAFDAYYADDVLMRENGGPATVGKAANRLREQEFLSSIAEFHKAEAPSIVVEGDRAAIHWILEFTNRQGRFVRYDQVALQTWRNGKVVAEQFFYDTADMVREA